MVDEKEFVNFGPLTKSSVVSFRPSQDEQCARFQTTVDFDHECLRHGWNIDNQKKGD